VSHWSDRPRNGYVVSIVVACLSGALYIYGSLARLEKDSQGRDMQATRLIDARNRETDDLKARLMALEAAVRNCRP
jgi:hypothetical protein